MVKPEVALKALAYVFGRIGRCIQSGGRRMLRLALTQSPHYNLVLPEREGKQGSKEAHRLLMSALRKKGTPNDEGKYVAYYTNSKRCDAKRKRRAGR